MEELASEVQAMYPNEMVSPSVFVTIYYAAKLNHPKQLVATLNSIQNLDLRNFLVNLRFDEVDGQSITPLTMAAIAGNVTFVHTLLSQYRVDLEQECNVIFDGLVVYGATALWAAAGMGHLQVVKLLVQYGANINHNTKAQSSPLRAACYEGRLDIVKYLIQHGANVNLANTYNNTSIMIAAYKGHVDVVATLLENGADPDMQALCGATALHYAAECGHIEVCSLLLDKGATLKKNEHSTTPVLVAAERTHERVVNMFIERPKLLTKEEIIEALELLGASFGNDKDHYDINKAFAILERAMEMRFSDPEDVLRKNVMRPVEAYDDWCETESMAELQAIRLNHHSLHMECLTIRERILGRTHPELPQPIVYRGAIMADQGRFGQCQKLWNYALDLRMANNVSVDRDLLRFVQLFSQIFRFNPDIIDLYFVLTVLIKCQLEIQNNRIKISKPGPKDVPSLLADQNEQNMMTALYLIKIVTRLYARPNVPDPPREHIEYLYSIIMTFIEQDPRMADGQTLLHLAVNGVTPVDDFYTSEICKFPCYHTALLLVNAGAHISAVDCERNTPLHKLIATSSREAPQNVVRICRIIKMFVDAEVHLDAVNANGLTACQLATDPQIVNYILGFQNARTTLKCLAARCVAFHRIPYKNMIPASLESFIHVHSTEKVSA